MRVIDRSPEATPSRSRGTVPITALLSAGRAGYAAARGAS